MNDVREVSISFHFYFLKKNIFFFSFSPKMAAKMEQTEKYLHPEKIAFAIYDVKLINHKSRGNPRYLGGILFDCEICSTIPAKQSALPSYCSLHVPLSSGEYLFARETKYLNRNILFSSDSPSPKEYLFAMKTKYFS